MNLIGYQKESEKKSLACYWTKPRKKPRKSAWLGTFDAYQKESEKKSLACYWTKPRKKRAKGLVREPSILTRRVREEIIRLALNKAPQEAVWNLAGNLRYLPEGVREEIIRLALNKAPQEAVWSLDWNLRCYPEWVREKIIRFSLRYLSEGFQVEIARLLLDKTRKKPHQNWLGILNTQKESRN